LRRSRRLRRRDGSQIILYTGIPNGLIDHVCQVGYIRDVAISEGDVTEVNILIVSDVDQTGRYIGDHYIEIGSTNL